MEELLGTKGGDPSEEDCKLYAEWAKGRWGMVLTGQLSLFSTPR